MHVNHWSVRSGLRTAAAATRRRLLQPFGQSLPLTVPNRTLTRRLLEGEFEFLIGRVLTVSITDLEVHWSFTANAAGDHIVPARRQRTARTVPRAAIRAYRDEDRAGASDRGLRDGARLVAQRPAD